MSDNTIKRAAELAGVSVASVSRALNGKPGISEKTRKRIVEICEQLGYQPSEAARRLKIGRDAHVALFLGSADTAHSHYTVSLFNALNLQLQERGLMLAIYSHSQIDSVMKNCGCAVLTGVNEGDARISALLKANFPFVAIGEIPEGFWVCPDDFQGGEIAAQHLIELGCKKHLIVERIVEGHGSKSRALGFQTYLQKQGHIPGRLYIDDKVAIELHTYRLISAMLSKNSFDFDAVFCETDEIAYGVMVALKDGGVDIPQQVKIIGFDDLPGFYGVLTTLRQDILKIAKSSVELLLEARHKKPFRAITLPVTLVKRESTTLS